MINDKVINNSDSLGKNIPKSFMDNKFVDSAGYKFKDVCDKLRKQRVPPAITKDGREYYLVQVSVDNKYVCSYRCDPHTGEVI